MEYVEIMRARRVLTWYTSVLLGIIVLTALSMYGGHADIRNGAAGVDASKILAACALGAFIIASCMSCGLSAEGATIAITWTRPRSRDAIAWRYVAVDVATIVLGYAILVAVCLAFFAMFGSLNRLHWDTGAPGAIVLVLGSALMWYGLVTLVSARFAGRGGMIAGLSWAAFFVVGTLWAAPLPPVLHGIATALNYLNPIAYMGGVSSSNEHVSHHAIELAQNLRIALAWAIAAGAIFAGVRLWSTREV